MSTRLIFYIFTRWASTSNIAGGFVINQDLDMHCVVLFFLYAGRVMRSWWQINPIGEHVVITSFNSLTLLKPFFAISKNDDGCTQPLRQLFRHFCSINLFSQYSARFTVRWSIYFYTGNSCRCVWIYERSDAEGTHHALRVLAPSPNFTCSIRTWRIIDKQVPQKDNIGKTRALNSGSHYKQLILVLHEFEQYYSELTCLLYLAEVVLI